MKLEFNSIDECFEFIQRINNSNIPKEEVTTMEMANNEKWLYNHSIVTELSLIWEELTKLKETDKKEDLEEVTEENTIRHYPKTYKSRLPKIIKFNKDGTFNVGRGKGKKAKWTIETLLQLRKCIKTDISVIKLGEKFDLSPDIVGRLMYCIEIGRFDKYFDEWEQNKANGFYNRFKETNKPIIENNPQKRREKGMY